MIAEAATKLGMFIFQIKHSLQINNAILLTPEEEIVEVEMEIQITLLVMTDNIPIDLVVDMVVFMVSQVEVMASLEIIHMELVQIASPPQSLEEDIDMTGILNNMINLSRADSFK